MSFLPPPMPPSTMPCINAPQPAHCVNTPGLHAASMPPACMLHQHPWPVHRINTPSLCAASTSPACAPCQCPQPAHCVDAPGLRTVLTPLACVLCQHPQPVRHINPSPLSPALPASALTPSPVQEEGLLPGFSPSPPLTLDKLLICRIYIYIYYFVNSELVMKI